MNTFGIINMARDSVLVPTLTWIFTAIFLMDLVGTYRWLFKWRIGRFIFISYGLGFGRADVTSVRIWAWRIGMDC